MIVDRANFNNSTLRNIGKYEVLSQFIYLGSLLITET